MHCENSEQILSAYLDGELSEKERCQVEDHIKNCDHCRLELERLRRTVEMLHDLPVISASPDFTRQVSEKLNMNGETPRITSLWRRGLAVAAVFLVIITAVFLVNDGIVQRVRSVREDSRTVESTDGRATAKRFSEAKEKIKRRPAAKQADREAERIKHSEKSPELEPHQIIALAPEKGDDEAYQMVELAKNMGLKKAHIDVKESGGTVITLRIKGREYERLLREIVEAQEGSVTITNTAVSRDSMYFKRLAQRYSPETDVSGLTAESGEQLRGVQGRSTETKSKKDADGVEDGAKFKKEASKPRARALESPETESAEGESDESGSPEEVILQIQTPAPREQ